MISIDTTAKKRYDGGTHSVLLLDIVDSLTCRVATRTDERTGIEKCIYCGSFILDVSGRTAHEHKAFCAWRLGKELVREGENE